MKQQDTEEVVRPLGARDVRQSGHIWVARCETCLRWSRWEPNMDFYCNNSKCTVGPMDGVGGEVN